MTEEQDRFDAFMVRMLNSQTVGARLADWIARQRLDAVRERELHHFETEQMLMAVVGLHSPMDPGPVSFQECQHCHVVWPCPTMKLLSNLS